jgi:hypothetical protein
MIIIRRISNGLEIGLRKIVNSNFDANLSFLALELKILLFLAYCYS